MVSTKHACLILLIASSLLLFGCIEKVDATQYQQVLSERDACVSQAELLRAKIPSYESRTNAAEKNYANCLSEKVDAQSEAQMCSSELSSSRSSADSLGASLSKIKGSTTQYDLYADIKLNYNVLFASGSIPTYTKLAAYEKKLAAANDSALLQKWNDYLNCPPDAVCTPKRDTFIAYVDSKAADGAATIVSAIKSS